MSISIWLAENLSFAKSFWRVRFFFILIAFQQMIITARLLHDPIGIVMHYGALLLICNRRLLNKNIIKSNSYKKIFLARWFIIPWPSIQVLMGHQIQYCLYRRDRLKIITSPSPLFLALYSLISLGSLLTHTEHNTVCIVLFARELSQDIPLLVLFESSMRPTSAYLAWFVKSLF